MPTAPYIVVAGNICSGKTTVCRQLARMIECVVYYEERDVFLKEYYSKPEQFALLNQLAYSIQYLEHAIQISRRSTLVIQDRSIYDTHCVFSRLQLDKNRMSLLEFGLLERMYHCADQVVRPSHLVLLDASIDTVFRRMRTRDVEEERSVPRLYLEELREMYLEWYGEFNLCTKAMFCTDGLLPEQVADEILRACDLESA